MQKKYLLAPGPTPVPERVLLAMAQPAFHHRTPQFEGIMAEVKEGLKYVFQTANDVQVFASSGTGAMEGAVSSFLSPGDKAITVNGGKFGERWTKICQAYGVEAIELKVEWGQAVDPQAVREALKKNPGVKAVYWQGSETSTGVAHPTKELAGIVRETSAISVVDGITAVGVIDIPSDDWGIDILVTGSQKALMLPPGLAFASVSPKAWELNKTAKCPRFYFDYKRENKALQANTTAWTPATSLIVGLAEVLKMMKEETREKVFARHTWLAHATREAAQAMGLKLLAPAAPSNALTAIWAPEGVDGGKIVKTLRNDLGITIAGGQDHLKGKIFRIAHLGYFDRFDVITAISATEMVLKKLGHKFQAGAGMAKANELLGL